VDELRWGAGLYVRLIGARVRAQLLYRTSLTLDVCGAFFFTFIDFAAVAVLFAHIRLLAGWSLRDVAFFYGIANVAFALSDMVVGHLDEFPRAIRTGSFDLLLVRPVPSLFQVIASDLALRRIGRVLQGCAVLIWALWRLPVLWTPLRVLLLVLTVTTGAVIYSSIWVIGATATFWIVEGREILNAFTYGGSTVASYPVNFFGGWTRRLLAFLVPMAFVSYFPGLYILGVADPLGTPRQLGLIAPAIALLLSMVAGAVWRTGIRHYRSTGS
jgi:ABC-2 type transport system permease protein